jgi:hypothetical protein
MNAAGGSSTGSGGASAGTGRTSGASGSASAKPAKVCLTPRACSQQAPSAQEVTSWQLDDHLFGNPVVCCWTTPTCTACTAGQVCAEGPSFQEEEGGAGSIRRGRAAGARGGDWRR